MRLILFLGLISFRIYAQDVNYQLMDDSIKVTVDILPQEGWLTVFWFTDTRSGILGTLKDTSTMLGLPVQDTFLLRTKYSCIHVHNGHEHIFWYWHDDPVTFNIEEPFVPNYPNPTYYNNWVTSPPGLVYIVERFGQLVFQSDTDGELYIDPNLFVQGFYYIKFWSPSVQQCWTVYK